MQTTLMYPYRNEMQGIAQRFDQMKMKKTENSP